MKVRKFRYKKIHVTDNKFKTNYEFITFAETNKQFKWKKCIGLKFVKYAVWTHDCLLTSQNPFFFFFFFLVIQDDLVHLGNKYMCEDRTKPQI